MKHKLFKLLITLPLIGCMVMLCTGCEDDDDDSSPQETNGVQEATSPPHNDTTPQEEGEDDEADDEGETEPSIPNFGGGS